MLRSDGADGFTIVEALVAFVVVAIGGAGLVLGLQSAVRAVEEAEQRFKATELAEELVWAARKGDPAQLASSGPIMQSGLSWRRTITPLAVNADVLRIEVLVPWTVGAQRREVRVVSYRRGYESDE